VLGVDHSTVVKDKAGENAPPDAGKSSKGAGSESKAGENAPPDLASESKTKTRKQRDRKAAAKRKDREQREASVRLSQLDVQLASLLAGELAAGRGR